MNKQFQKLEKNAQTGRGKTICLIVVLFSTFLACGCGQAKQARQQSEAGNSFVGKLVTFEIPKDWILQNHVTQNNVETFQFLIPDMATEGTPDSANAGISIEKLPDGLDVTNFANLRLQTTSSPDGYAVLAKIFAGGKWCSALTRGQQEVTPYIVMDRFGVDQGVMVLLRIAQPVLTNNFDVVAHSISNFNTLVNSLRIGGTNAINSEMRQDHGTIWLRSFSDSDTNWMASPTNNIIFRSPLPSK